MKQKTYYKNTAKILVIALLLMLSPVFAETISAALVSTKVVVNGNQIELKDAKGNDLQPINYNGSIYLPVRSISKAFNQPIEYDAKNNLVKIGKEQKDSKPFYLLKDWSLLKENENLQKVEKYEDYNGKTYESDHAVSFQRGVYPVIGFDTNNRYTRLTGTIAPLKNKNTYDSKIVIKIKGDDKELYTQQIQKDSIPVDFDVNVTGVKNISIRIDGYDITDFFLADLALWQ